MEGAALFHIIVTWPGKSGVTALAGGSQEVYAFYSQLSGDPNGRSSVSVRFCPMPAAFSLVLRCDSQCMFSAVTVFSGCRGCFSLCEPV